MLAVSDPFLLSTHVLRPDIQIVTLALLALALVEFGLASGRAWPPLLAGVLLGLSFDTHMNTVGLMPIVGLAPLLRHGRGAFRRRDLWLIGAGLGLAAAYYLLVRVIPDPGGYVAAASYWIGVDKTPPVADEGGSGGVLGLLHLEFLRFADYFGLSPEGLEEPAELGLLLVALVAGSVRALRGSLPDRTLLLGLLLTALFFVFAVKTKSRYYMVLTYPLYALLVARLLLDSVRWVRRPRMAQAVLVGLTVLMLAWPLKFYDRTWDKYIRGHRYREGQDYYLLTSRLESLAGADSKVLAPPVYWFGLMEHPFTDIFVFERVRKQYGESAAEFLEKVRPDFIVTDAKIATDRAIERELYRAIEERAGRELVVRHKNFGDVAVYRLRWQ
jgi:hypothetical protein